MYNFKRNTKLYIVHENLQYPIEVYPDLTFSQTFIETPIEVKTLHEQDQMFDGAIIKKANPANFSFTSPMLVEEDLEILLDLILSYQPNSVLLNTADIYVESDTETYKLEGAVFETATFQIQREANIAVNVAGTASKLSKFIGVIPGIPQIRSSTRRYIIPSAIRILIDGIEQDYVTSINLEVQNTVSWLEAANLHNILNINSASGTCFHEAFVVEKRQITGNIQEHVTSDNNADVNTWKTSVPLRIAVGDLRYRWYLEALLDQVVFTNRLDPTELYIQSYDFRLVSKPTIMPITTKLKANILSTYNGNF